MVSLGATECPGCGATLSTTRVMLKFFLPAMFFGLTVFSWQVVRRNWPIWLIGVAALLAAAVIAYQIRIVKRFKADQGGKQNSSD